MEGIGYGTGIRLPTRKTKKSTVSGLGDSMLQEPYVVFQISFGEGKD